MQTLLGFNQHHLMTNRKRKAAELDPTFQANDDASRNLSGEPAKIPEHLFSRSEEIFVQLTYVNSFKQLPAGFLFPFCNV